MPCVPCDCNGHSTQCEVSSGICFNCMGNTEGDFCGKCKDGFFGDPTTGDCSPCNCDSIGSSGLVCNKVSAICHSICSKHIYLCVLM